MPAVVTRDEYLSFDSTGGHPVVPLNTPAWECRDYRPLYDGTDTVGDNRPIPGSAGRLYVPDEFDEWNVSLNLVVYGDQDQDGGTHSDPRVGVRENLLYLRTHLLRPRLLRPVTFHRLDGGTETGDVKVSPRAQVTSFGPSGARMVLKFVVVAGAFTEVGS
jgi:hypothetical protein